MKLDFERDFADLDLVDSYFPLVFLNGSRWEEISAICASCDRKVFDQMVRGEVTQPTPKVFVVEAFAFCEPCNTYSDIRLRLHDDMTMTGIRNGEWVRWDAKKRWPLWKHATLAVLLGILLYGFLERVARP